MPRSTPRTWVQTTAQALTLLEITTPSENARVSAATFTAAWTFNAIQDQYRAQIFDNEDAGTEDEPVWDSGWTVSGTQSASLATSGLVSNGIYYLKLFAHAADGEEGESELVPFYYALPTGANVEGLRVRPLPKCNPSPLDLPGNMLTWTEAVETGDEEFLCYEVQRREAGSDKQYERIARIADGERLHYLDVNAAPGVEYEYVVLFYADDSTPKTLLSMPQDPAPRSRVDFDFIYLHEVAEPKRFFRAQSHEGSVLVNADISYAQAWGNTKPTLFVGEAQWHTIILPGLDRARNNPTLWRAMRAVFERQSTDPSTLCLRLGYDRERYFVGWDKLSKALNVRSFTEYIQLTEVEFSEDIGLYEHTPGIGSS